MRALDYAFLSAIAVLLGLLADAWLRVLRLRNGAHVAKSDIARLIAEGSAAQRMHLGAAIRSSVRT
jgi:hypothetical protein